MKLIRTCLGQLAGLAAVPVVVAEVLVVAGDVVPVWVVVAVGVVGVLVVPVTTLPLLPQAAMATAAAIPQPITRILNVPPVRPKRSVHFYIVRGRGSTTSALERRGASVSARLLRSFAPHRGQRAILRSIRVCPSRHGVAERRVVMQQGSATVAAHPSVSTPGGGPTAAACRASVGGSSVGPATRAFVASRLAAGWPRSRR
jgi:hypothetical protein